MDGSESSGVTVVADTGADASGTARSLVLAYFDALNGEDWERLSSLWEESAELRAVGARPRHGRQDLMAYFHPLFTGWAAHLDQPTRLIVAGSTVVVEVQFTGTTHDGKEISFDAVDVFDVGDHGISRLTTWYDLAWLRKQL
jgi:ketosteroid isomerase-like protein